MFLAANSIERQLLLFSSYNAGTVALVGEPTVSKLVWSLLQSKSGNESIDFDQWPMTISCNDISSWFKYFAIMINHG